MRGLTTLLALCFLASSSGFYLPGVSPRTWKAGEAVNIKVQTLVSPESQLQFDYYQLPFCKPDKIVDLPENLGEALAGEKAHTSAFKAKMKESTYCQTVCRMDYTKQQMEEFQDFAILEYRVNMRVDNLPVAEVSSYYYDDKPDQTIQLYNLGFALGAKLHEEVHADEPVAEKYVLNNHLRFKILYHAAPGQKEEEQKAQDNGEFFMKGYLIVGFQVVPYSIKHTYNGEWQKKCAPNCPLTTCMAGGSFTQHEPQHIVTSKQEGSREVIWTYDIVWEKSDIMWASRWDVYLNMKNDSIHWYSITNSIVVLLFLSGIVGIILQRVLRNDLNAYNEGPADAAEAAAIREESGWKLLHADIFRPPKFGQLLSVYVATGVQLLVMSIIILVLASVGFLSPSHRGSLLGAFVTLFVFTGTVAGYVAARLSKLLQEENRLRVTLMTSLVFPGVSFVIFLILDLLMWAQASSSAVPFGSLIAVMFLWFCISVPLVFLGAYIGFKIQAPTFPCRTNQIPREIPAQPWARGVVLSMLCGGLLPFGAMFVEMFFILSSIWQHRFYYMFGFLFLVFIVLVTTCAEICIVMCYLHLTSEDYRWWWRSAFTGGSVGLYLFGLGAYHYVLRTHHAIDLLSSLIYFGYLTLACYAFSVMTAAVGFLSCFFFIWKIYSSVKID